MIEDTSSAGSSPEADAEFLRSVLSASADCIKVLDLDGTLRFMNEGALRLMEVDDFSAIEGCAWSEFWRGEGHEQAKAAVENARGGRTARFRGAADTLSGRSRLWDVQVTPMFDADGRAERLLVVSRDVTEAQEATEAHQASEIYWRGLFERLHEGFILGELVRGEDGRVVDWRYLDVNPAWSALVGVPAEAAVGRTIREVFPGVEDSWIGEMAEVVASGRAATFTRQVGVLDRWYEGRAFALEGDKFAVLFLEVTERVRADARQAALQELDALNRQILNSAIDYAIIATDLEGRITRWNEGAQRVLGWSEDEMIGQGAERFFTPEDVSRGQVAKEMRDALATGCGTDERWHRRANGERFWADGEMTVLHDEAGSAIGFVKVLRDRTSQRRAEQALQDSEGRLRALTAATSDALFTLSPDWEELRQLNGGGFLPEISSAKRMWLDELVYPDDRELVRQAYLEAIRTKGVYELEHRVPQEGGGIGWTHSRAVPLLDSQGEIVEWFGAATDVTARHVAETELRHLTETLEQRVKERTGELLQAEEALRQSQKLEAVGQLTGGVAHDFNNLLTIIRSSVDFLKRDDLSPARRIRYVEAISDTVERASKLTSQLLAFARRQPLKPQVFDVSARVQDVSDLIRPLVGARIAIEVQPCERPCYTEADVSQFETALVNLAVNARDAMDGEGALRFAVREAQAVPAIRGHAGAAGDFIAISVADTGEGIAADQIASIFEPFYTTKEVGKGTGLGLSQVFGFTKQSGGEVDVESEPGAGAVFTLYLPRVAADAHAMAPPRPPHEENGQATAAICVLIVEDNENVGRFADEMLKDLGYSTKLVGSAGEALEALSSDAAGFDVVFSDVIMPGMNGVELAREIRRRLPTLPVVLTSGYSSVLAQEGAHGFELLRKPYSIEELSRVLRRISTIDDKAAESPG